MGNSILSNRKRSNSRSLSNLSLTGLNYYATPVVGPIGPYVVNTLPDDDRFKGDRFSTSCTKYRLHMISLE